jgi:hypothetical protein
VDGQRAMATVNQNNYVTATDDRGEVRLFGSREASTTCLPSSAR